MLRGNCNYLLFNLYLIFMAYFIAFVQVLTSKSSITWIWQTKMLNILLTIWFDWQNLNSNEDLKDLWAGRDYTPASLRGWTKLQIADELWKEWLQFFVFCHHVNCQFMSILNGPCCIYVLINNNMKLYEDQMLKYLFCLLSRPCSTNFSK